MQFGFVEFGICKRSAIEFLVAFLVIGLLVSDGLGQDLEIFSGRGIASGVQRQLPQTEQKRQVIPNINNFLKDEVSPSAARNPFSGLFKKPKLPGLDGLKPKPAGEIFDRSNPLADLLPKRDSSKPNFFQKMNSRSKDFLEKTKGWAKGKGVQEKSNETWNNAIREFKTNHAKIREQVTSPAQPNFRSAEAIGEPKLRF